MFRLALLAVVIGLVPLAGAQNEPAEMPDEKAATQPSTPDLLHPRVKMTTTLGEIVLELDAEKAPITVQNFLQYAHDGFYVDTVFHRVIANFMIQGGGFTTEMDQKQEGLRPPIKNEWKNGLKNARGTVAMARTNAPDSATSQFFINVVDNKQLDMPRGGAAYCVFGRVVEGIDVVDKVKSVELILHPKYKAPKPVTPKEPVVIESVGLLEGYGYDAVFEAIKKKHAARFEAEERARLEREKKQLEEEKKRKELAAEFQELLDKGVDRQGNQLQTTSSGLMYVVLEEGEGPLPGPTNTVVTHCTGWLLDGKEFFTTRGKQPLPVALARPRVIDGWKEALPMMKAGATWRLIIPPELAYGDRGRPGKIPPKSTLVFDVEMVEIK